MNASLEGKESRETLSILMEGEGGKGGGEIDYNLFGEMK